VVQKEEEMRVKGLKGAILSKAAVATVVAVASVAALSPNACRCDEYRAITDYPSESSLLVETPGTSSSALAGIFNPASWPLIGGERLFLGIDDLAGRDVDNWAAVLSLGNLGFGVRHVNLGIHEPLTSSFTDYTIGLGSGTRSGAFGVSYSWATGDLDRTPRHERITAGYIGRSRQASFGVAETLDLESRDNSLQVDLGVRPMGPRLTLFGDAEYGHGDSFEDIRTGYGVEVKPIPGLALAAKIQSTGDFGFRVGVDLSRQTRASFRPRFDDDGDRTASSYSIEFGPERPAIGHGYFGAGRSYPVMSLRGSLTYRRYKYFDNRRTLLGTLGRINSVADDPRAGGVVLNLSGMSMTPEVAWEIREQLAGLRARGKRVIVYFDRVSVTGGMLASVADQIWMDPAGMMDVRGLSMGRTYYRNLLNKMGLGVEEWRFLEYKSAFESLARDSMSVPDREQRQALLDDFYEEAAGLITSARGMSRAALDEVVNDKALLLPEEALAAGLVDSVGTMQDAVRAARSADPRSTGDGSLSVLEGLMGDPVWGPLEWGEPPRIALLYAIGPCAMDSGIHGRALSKRIREAREDPDVKAVVLRADSPGGDALPSDLVSRELKLTARRKPVIVSQGQVAGSGGYWISMYGDTIVASPLTITGSIGVIGGWIWNEGFGDKVGLTYDGVQRGRHADLGAGISLPFVHQTVPERPLTGEEHERMEYLMRTLYKSFVDKVAEGRGMTEAEVDAVGQGRVWSGTRGVEKGLVDKLGGLWYSLRLAKKAAGIPDDDAVAIDEGPDLGAFNLKSLFSPGLFGLGASEPEPAVEAESVLPRAELDYLERLVESRGEPLLMMQPMELIDGSR
jgi:protease-4